MKHLIWLIPACMLLASQASAQIPKQSSKQASSQTLIGTSTVPALLDDADIPDAMQHLVKAPKIDIASLRDPFASYLARAANVGSASQPGKQIHLSDRQREKLEAFDLGTLRLVAIFSMGGERVAMIEDATSKGHIIRRGNYLGKHNGKIEKIDDNTVFLVEQIINPAGDIIDRQVSLTMQETNE